MSRQRSWSKGDYRAKCPLHVAWRDDEIMCSAAMPDSTVTIHRFSDCETAQRQKELFCQTVCYERCEHYKSWKHFIWEDDE